MTTFIKVMTSSLQRLDSTDEIYNFNIFGFYSI